MKANIEQVNIGPKEAQEWLANPFENQRPVNQRHVERVTQIMKRGEWRLSPDMIVRIKNKLANGQHRLLAVVRSNTRQNFLLLNSTDDELFKILDCGKTRSIGDVIGGQYAVHVAAVARLVVLYDLDMLSIGGAGNNESKCTRSMQIEYAEDNREAILEHVVFCKSMSMKYRIVAPNIAAMVSFIGARDSGEPEKVRKFITHVYNGESSEDSAKDFRERMIRDRSGTSHMRRFYVLAIMIKSLRSYLQGTRLGTIKVVDGESFPKL